MLISLSYNISIFLSFIGIFIFSISDPVTVGLNSINNDLSVSIRFIIFDIIFGKGLAQEENENERRMMIKFQEAMKSEEVRQVIRAEINKAFILYKEDEKKKGV